ncbi:hypothetical protein H6P81_002770 [Aristolochia fimbriata]|uniref:Uncharacterized protein n=1 Tax=Aristolochia fimbriata TaxID=158543 RepID=A0AAV7FDX4_ARIFI|nr:hypothetical protein H6P81_002770 [Aristolochia fimbriata]
MTQITPANGNTIDFWTDYWLTKESLSDKYPDLFAIARLKKISFNRVIERNAQQQINWEQLQIQKDIKLFRNLFAGDALIPLNLSTPFRKTTTKEQIIFLKESTDQTSSIEGGDFTRPDPTRPEKEL